MTQHNEAALNALENLRSNLNHADVNHPDIISLKQAFDRLCLDCRAAKLSDAELFAAINQIQSQLDHAGATSPLIPHNTSQRTQVLSRNYRDLAAKLLDQPNGSWDARHVEIVHGAIAHLAANHDPDARQLAQDFQNRMSNNVWLGNVELHETIAQLQSEADELQNSIALAIADRFHSEQNSNVDSSDRALATISDDQQNEIRNMVRNSQINALRDQLNTDANALKNAKAYVEQLAKSAEQQNQNKNNALQAEIQNQAAESLKHASKKLVQTQYDKLIQICRQSLLTAKNYISDSNVDALNKTLSALEISGNATPAQLSDAIQLALNALKPLANNAPALKQALSQIHAIDRNVKILADISEQKTVQTPAHTDTSAAAQYLDARMLFEQKKFQFEQKQTYAQTQDNLVKALDFNIQAPEFDRVSAHPNTQNMLNNIQRVRQIAQSDAAGDIGLYAPHAGAEQNLNAKRALNLADHTTPNHHRIPTLQSARAQRSNKLLNDIKQFAFMPSVRADMGFTTAHWKIAQDAAQPLFKRVRFSQNNQNVNEMLPALYNISGVKMKKSPDAPLRKSFADLDLRGANLELVKIIENQFDNTTQGRMTDKVSGAAFDTTQQRKSHNDSHGQALGVISDWIQAGHSEYKDRADTTSLVKSGHLNGKQLESSLKSEGMTLPKSVQDKLSPFLGFDISNIKVYSGPIAAMASQAMGAHAFTLGHSVFLGENKLNFSSPEGLGLLAHELLHTSHFDSSMSVDSKEQQAEDIEARVKNAFGSSAPALALEKKKSNPETDKRSTLDNKPIANTVGAHYDYDEDYIFDYVCDYVFERMIDEIRNDRERSGDDN